MSPLNSGSSATDNNTQDNTPDIAVTAPPAGGSLVLYVDGVAVPATYNPTVLIAKTVFLQRIQEAVGDGYRYYATGTIPPHRALGLARKFAETYGVHWDKNERYRRKAAGLGNARLVLGDLGGALDDCQTALGGAMSEDEATARLLAGLDGKPMCSRQ